MLAALARGDIGEDRMESYRKLRAEARHHEVMTDKFAALEQKRNGSKKSFLSAAKQHAQAVANMPADRHRTTI